MDFVKDLLGFGRRQIAPVVVRAARVGLAAGFTAFAGALTVALGDVDWGDYAPYAVFIMGAFSLIMEGIADQLKARGQPG